MTQADLDAGTDLVNVATVDTNQTNLQQDDTSSTVAQSKILHIEKDATVPGGTADVAGETISYTLAVTNQGNAAIANVVVDDPFTTNEAPVLSHGIFNVGDADNDSLLDVSETWQYTASHQVTQAELDAGTAIVNTATVTGAGATPDTDDASVPVVQSKVLHLEKDATVAGGTADVAGETISYTLAVTNQGNAAIANVVVDDPFTTNEAPVLVRHLQCRRHRPGQPAGRERDLAVHGQPSGDAGRAGRRDAHRQHGDGDRRRGDPGHRRRLGCRWRRARSCTSRRTPTVADGTANATSDVINYTLAVTNTGNAAIANVVVDDPFTTNEAPVLVRRLQCRRHRPGQPAGRGRDLAVHGQPSGDAGRARRRRRPIDNTATVTGDGATPDDDGASVPVVQSPSLHDREGSDERRRRGCGHRWRDDRVHDHGCQHRQHRPDQCGSGRRVCRRRDAGQRRPQQQQTFSRPPRPGRTRRTT